MRVSPSVVSFVASTTFLMGTTPALASPAWDEEPLGSILYFPSTTFSTSVSTRKNLRRAARRSPPEDSSHRQLSTVKVGTSSPECDSDYVTIMDALDNEDSPVTIELCAETYNEDILIDEDFEVKIKGEGMGASIIKPLNSPRAIVNAAAGNIKVELEMLTLDGNNNMDGFSDVFCEGNCGVAGLACENCTAKVREVEFINIFSSSTVPNEVPSFDIFARSRTPGAGYKITVEESEFPTAGTIGVLVDGPGLEAEIKKNNITLGNPPASFALGIQGSRQAKVKIESNTLTGYTGRPFASSAITVLCPRSDTFVKKNQINDADLGIVLINSDMVDVEDNDIVDSTNAAIQLQYQEQFVVPSTCPDPLGVTNNKVKDNTIFNSTFGVVFLADPSVENSTLTDNTVENNVITDSPLAGILLLTGDENTIKYNVIERSFLGGIFLAEPTGAGLFDFDYSAPPAGGNLIKKNDISDSENFGIFVEAGEENIFVSNEIVSTRNGTITSFPSGIGISGGSDSLFKNNKIIDSAANGVVLYDGAGVPTDYLLEGNDVDVSDVGFNIVVAADTVLKKNKVENSDPPLLNAGTNTILIDNDF